MTLNQTLLTDEIIFQCADFRLTNADTGVVTDDSSMKLVSLHYDKWDGFVTYTGIGSFRKRDTAAWVEEWLTGLAGATPDQVAERLREKGTEVLRSIERASGSRYRHTFVLAAFVDGSPCVYTISNFEDCSGKSNASASTELQIDSRWMGRGPVLLVTGQKRAVSRPSRRRLERAAASSAIPPAQIRNLLMQINAEAAESAQAGGTISAESTVASLRRDGSGFQDFSDAARVELRSMSEGQSFGAFRKLFPEGLGYLAGASFSKGGPDVEQVPHPRCQPQIVIPQDSGGYELHELKCDDFDSAHIYDVNEDAVVLGSGTRAREPGFQLMCVWQSDQTCELLDQVGKPGAINRRGEVAATARMEDESDHATRWTIAGPQDLGTFCGRDSGADAINDLSMVAGWISLSDNAEARGQPYFRPALWQPGSEIAVLLEFGCEWGQVADLNSAGLALVRAFEPGIPAVCRALLWDPVAGTHQFVGGDEARGIYPVGLTDDGLILGFARNQESKAVAGVSQGGGPWQKLGTADAWYPTALNDRGHVAGSLPVDGFERPWIRSPDGEITFLPYFAYHVCRPVAITNAGIVVGTAATDHGSHALLWSPPT